MLVNSKLRDYATGVDGVEYYDITDYLCTDGLCCGYDMKGTPLYYDPTHLAMSASWKIGKEIVDKLSGVPYPFTLIPVRCSPQGNQASL